MRCGCRPQMRFVAAALAAVAKVVADNDGGNAELAHQQVVDEGLGRHRRQRLGETRDDDTLQTAMRQRIELAAQRLHARRRVGAAEVFTRRGLERHRRRGQAEPAGDLQRALHQSLVTAVHAVEVTDRQHAAAMLRAQVLQTADQLHAWHFWHWRRGKPQLYALRSTRPAHQQMPRTQAHRQQRRRVCKAAGRDHRAQAGSAV